MVGLLGGLGKSLGRAVEGAAWYGAGLAGWLAVGLAASAAAGLIAGCDPMADRMVDRHSTELAADLRVRGQLARQSIETQYEAVRASRHAEIDAVRDQAFKALELAGRLDARLGQQAADRFASYHRLVDARVDAYLAAALQQTEWFDLASDTVLATMEYRQTKDAAVIAGLNAALEAFGPAYAATKREPVDEADAKAQGLIQQLEQQLGGMLQAYTGAPVAAAK
ncbi:MAG TPA: hypothetical protein PK458_20430 [Phycisphaerae bacterium]|nr:hypothetical protein [Phycisphaerae bacterium]